MRLDLSCSEGTEEGRFLGRLYYNTIATELFTNDERSGFPHDGGRHSFKLDTRRVRLMDIEAFLDLLKERWGQAKGYVEFESHVRARICGVVFG